MKGLGLIVPKHHNDTLAHRHLRGDQVGESFNRSPLLFETASCSVIPLSNGYCTVTTTYFCYVLKRWQTLVKANACWFTMEKSIRPVVRVDHQNIKTKHPGIREAAYKTTVSPKVEYASLVWSPYTNKTFIR